LLAIQAQLVPGVGVEGEVHGTVIGADGGQSGFDGEIDLVFMPVGAAQQSAAQFGAGVAAAVGVYLGQRGLVDDGHNQAWFFAMQHRLLAESRWLFLWQLLDTRVGGLVNCLGRCGGETAVLEDVDAEVIAFRLRVAQLDHVCQR
jgi:hypothetical protein